MTRRNFVGGAIGVVILATTFTVLFMFGRQVLWWSEHGTWRRQPVSEILVSLGAERPAVTWRGVQQMIDFAWNLDAGLSRAHCWRCPDILLGRLQGRDR